MFILRKLFKIMLLSVVFVFVLYQVAIGNIAKAH